MPCLRRHQLIRLTEIGWEAVLRRPWDDQAHQCLTHWAAHRLPLVVTRQPTGVVAADSIALGLPAPAQWERRRLALQVPQGSVHSRGEFPLLAELFELLPPGAERPARELLDALAALHSVPHVFGSFGWQAISGLPCVRTTSDLDLLIAVDGLVHADAVARVLHSFCSVGTRLDGELVFGDGSAVAWREWIEWRAGRVRAIMVRRLDAVALQHDIAWCKSAEPAEAGA